MGHIKSEDQYIVAKDYIVCVELLDSEGKPRKLCLTVPRGTLTDLATVPRPFRLFVGRVGPHLEASIIHDYLYIAWQRLGVPPTDKIRLYSDKVMLKAMLEAGMGCKAFAIYLVIRCLGTCIFYGRNPEPLILCNDKISDCCCDRQDENSEQAAQCDPE